MLAISLEQAKSIALAVAGLSTAASAISALVVKAVIKKVVLAVVFLLIAVAFWTQRTAVTDCAGDAASNALSANTTCTFFGFDVTLPTGAGRS